tara:strand:- start:4313 stop:4852 length:540 start_codon:yes stop_codon:yes gene_type:complete
MIKEKEIFNDVYKFELENHDDDRGFFSEIYKKTDLIEKINKGAFIQDNLSFSKSVNTIRGLHYQLEPFDQSKYVIVLQGSIWDVFIDLREESPTFLEYGFIELNQNQSTILIPKGFAHGFCTLTENTLVLYKVDNFYSKKHEKGIVWNDKTLNIPWPLKDQDIIISDRDKELPSLELKK